MAYAEAVRMGGRAELSLQSKWVYLVDEELAIGYLKHQARILKE